MAKSGRVAKTSTTPFGDYYICNVSRGKAAMVKHTKGNTLVCLDCIGSWSGEPRGKATERPCIHTELVEDAIESKTFDTLITQGSGISDLVKQWLKDDQGAIDESVILDVPV